MMKRRKVILWTGGIAGGAMLLLCILLLLAPLLVNLESIHRDILARFDRETGGQGAFRDVKISFFPRPHAAICEGSLSLKNQEVFSFERMMVYPKLLPLLRGAFFPSRIELSSPVVNVPLPVLEESHSHDPPSTPKEGKPIRPSILEEWINKTEGLEIQVENGIINLGTKGGAFFHFKNIDLTAEHSVGSLTLQLTCASNLFENMTLKAQTGIPSFKTKGSLALKGFKSGDLPDHLKHRRSLKLERGAFDLEADVEGSGLQSLKAKGSLTAPVLTFSRGQRRTTLKDAQLSGNIDITEESYSASLSNLTFGYPAMRLSGTFRKQPNNPPLSIHLEGEMVDIPTLRSCALDLADDISTVHGVFDIIKGGTVSSLSIDAKGKTMADLGHLNGYTIEGIMRGGYISLTDPKMDLTNVAGSALISRSTLIGQRLQAKLGQIAGKEGILAVPLEDGAQPFHLDILLDADLAEAHSFLKALVPEGPFKKRLHRIRSMEGRAAARLLLDAPDKKEQPLRVGVDCTSLNIKTAYQSLPLQINVSQGQFRYRQNRVEVKDLKGSYGDSRVHVVSGGLNWGNEPYLEIASAGGSILLEQLYPIISNRVDTGKWLKPHKSLKGRILVHSMDFKGPLQKPGAWRYHWDSEIEKLLLNTDLLPGPLKAAKARLKMNPEVIRIEGAQIKILDSDLNVTGVLSGSPKGPDSFEADFTGTLGDQGMKYLHHKADLPKELLLRTPLTVRPGHISWIKNKETDFSGNLNFPDGPTVSSNVSYGTGKLNVRQLVVKEDDTSASLEILANDNLVDFSFRGILKKSALDGIFRKNTLLGGWIDGSISAQILPTQSFATSAEGVLRGNDITIHGAASPAKIVDFSLRAESQQLHFDALRLLLGGNKLTVSGNADLSTEDPRFDVDVATDSVDLDNLLVILKKSESEKTDPKKGDPWQFPIRGTAHLMWDSLKIGGFTWEPFQGEIGIERDRIRVSVENAKLCGISSTGFLKIKQDQAALNLHLKAEKGKLNQCITCLTHERVIADGTFDLVSNISAQGDWKALPARLEGPILFSATNGKVKQDPALARVISVLNVTDIFKGKLPTLDTDGFPYDRVQISGNLKDGRIQIQKGLMNSSAMNLVFNGDVDLLNEQLDIRMLASPFTLTDRLIRLLPVAGYILGGTLISVPIKIHGPLKDPKVKILLFSEIGSGVWGMMKRALETPAKIVEPLVGEGEKSKSDDDESIFW